MKVRLTTDYYEPMLANGSSYEVKKDFVAPSPFRGDHEDMRFFRIEDSFGEDWDVPFDCVSLD